MRRERRSAAVAAQLEASRQRAETERARLEASAARAREKTARHMITQARDVLFLELVRRLAEVDPDGSAEILAKGRAAIAKWETDGKRILDQETT